MALSTGSSFPDLTGATEWINECATSESLLGHPCIVQFWAVSCPICKINLPRLLQMLQTYQKQELELISIHMPRMEADMDVEKVTDTMRELNLVGSCAIDNNHALGDRFQTGGIWPSYFLYDSAGKLRSRAAGELGLKLAENSLRRMLETETA